MSIFPREFELLVVFVCRESPMWRKVFGPDPRKTAFNNAIVNQTKLLRWRRGTKISKQSPAQIFDNARRQISARTHNDERTKLLKQVDDFALGYFEHRDDFDIRAAANVLHMPIEAAYRALDTVTYRHFPLFPGMLHRGQKHIAERHFRTFRGAWQVWLRRELHSGQVIYLLAALRVREVAEVADGYAIRCKFNVPLIDVRRHSAQYSTPAKPYQYDGFLTVPTVQDHLNFTFEFRQDDTLKDMREDYFHIMTSWIEKIADGADELRGDYLTMDQGGSPRLRVKDSLVMRRSAVDNRESILECMRDVRVIRDVSEHRMVEEMFLETVD